MRRVQTSVVLLLLVCAACTPRGPFAGGPLSGKPGPAHVASWEFAADEEVLELETRPEDPRSVTLWFWADGPSLYVASSLIGGTKEPSERTWVAHITGNPRVRILIRGLIYERRARRVQDDSDAMGICRATLWCGSTNRAGRRGARRVEGVPQVV